MTSIVALDIVIGLVFVYLLYSMLASIVQEVLATIFSFRSKVLERAIYRMLEDGNLFNKRFTSIIALFRKSKLSKKSKSIASSFYNHPMIKFLGEDKYNSKPSYLTKEIFSKVMIDLLRGDQLKAGDDIRPLVEKSIEEGKLVDGGTSIDKETLKFIRSIWIDSQGDLDVFRKSLENWFDATMERCSGWYKKQTQYILLAIGLIIAVVFNVDSIGIAGKLEKDPKLRDAVVQQADAFTKAHPNLYQERIDDLNNNKKAYNAAVAGSKNDSNATKDTLRAKIRLAKSDSIARAKNDSLIDRGIYLTRRADSLVNGDIAKMNGVLGLGWSSICKKDVKKKKDNTSNISKPNDSVNNKIQPKDSLQTGSSVAGIKSQPTQVKTAGSGFWKTTGEWVYRIIGWIITALAISLGAPFWFDLLSKLMKLRGSISTANTTKDKETSDKNTPTIIRKG